MPLPLVVGACRRPLFRSMTALAAATTMCLLAGASGSAANASVTAPAQGGSVSNAVAINIQHERGVHRVTFLLDGRTRDVDAHAPFAFGASGRLSTTHLANGRHRLEIRIRTARGTRVVRRAFMVHNATATAAARRDKRAPTVSWVAPAANSTVSGSVSCQANATDDVGVSRVEIFVGSKRLVSDTTAPYNCSWDTTLVANGTQTLTAVAYDAAGNHSQSTRSVTVNNGTPTPTPPPSPAPPPPPPPSGGTAAPFPSRLHASGRSLVDENGVVMPKLKGFNAQVVPWSQADFAAMKNVGSGIVRQVIFWDAFQPNAPASGVGINGTGVSQAMVDALDTQVKNTEAAGLYSFFSFHLNVNRDPSWTTGIANETQRYATYGKTLTQFLANRYGNPSSPQYTKSVVGLGLNEPPPTDSANPNPGLESVQSNMISWFRASAPQWIGFVTFAYASSTPIYNRSWQSTTAADANPHAYDAAGGNVVVDFHDYFWGVTSSCVPSNGVSYTSPSAEMRWPNGLPHNECFAPAGTQYATSSTITAQHARYIAPYKQFSINANVPLMLGEWGWVPSNSGADAYVTDAKNVWADAGTALQLQWDYDVTPSQEPFASFPNRSWTPWTLKWMAP
jgi:hypothetical protein